MAGSNGKAKGGSAQAERHARRAKEKADARREQATGAAGWVADRAGEWSLEAQDLTWMDRQKYLWNPLMDYWFRMEMEGWVETNEAGEYRFKRRSDETTSFKQALETPGTPLGDTAIISLEDVKNGRVGGA